MSGVDGVGLASYEQISAYLRRAGEDRLLRFVREVDGRYELASDEYAKIKAPSVQYQIACVFMLLGEYSVAEELYALRWSDLSGWGDKVGNGLLQHFMKPWPAGGASA